MRLKSLLFSFFLTSLFITQPAFATPYGGGSYNAGTYSPTSTPTPTPTVIQAAQSASSSNSTNSSNSHVCSNQKPTSAPYLYQIDRLRNTATVYFSPAGNPYDHFWIAFGRKDGVEEYGDRFNIRNSTGAVAVKIEHLTPGTTYYFKVRGGNGCATGAWSNSVMARGVAVKGNTKASFYPNQTIAQRVYNYAKNKVNTIFNTNKKKSTPTPTVIPPKKK